MAVTWRGVELDQSTIDKLKEAEQILGFQLSFPQGSYSNSVSASAGTHSGGGAVDVHCVGLPTTQRVAIVHALREVGFAAWHRTPIPNVWGEHIHCIEIGNPNLSSAAKSQITQWNRGLDGLADWAKDADSIDVAAGHPAIVKPSSSGGEPVLPLLGVDFSYARPSISQLKAAGVHFVVRYVGWGTGSSPGGKFAAADEVKAYQSAGIGVCLVFETTASRALAGQAAGQADAQTALSNAVTLGLGQIPAIYMAVDTDTSWANVRPYFQGANSVLGDRTGIYGGSGPVSGAKGSGLVHWYWQTAAWSGGVTVPGIHLYQYASGAPLTDTDKTVALQLDYGQWPRPEVDMPLTDTEMNTVAARAADAVVNKLLPNKFRPDAKGNPGQTSVANFLIYGDAHYDALHADLAKVKAALADLKTQLAALAAALPKP